MTETINQLNTSIVNNQPINNKVTNIVEITDKNYMINSAKVYFDEYGGGIIINDKINVNSDF